MRREGGRKEGREGGEGSKKLERLIQLYFDLYVWGFFLLFKV